MLFPIILIHYFQRKKRKRKGRIKKEVKHGVQTLSLYSSNKRCLEVLEQKACAIKHKSLDTLKLFLEKKCCNYSIVTSLRIRKVSRLYSPREKAITDDLFCFMYIFFSFFIMVIKTCLFILSVKSYALLFASQYLPVTLHIWKKFKNT